MTHRVTQVGSEPIILIEVRDPFVGSEGPQVTQKVLALKDKIKERPVYRLMDFSNCQMQWNEMQKGFATQIHGEPGSMTDPDLRPVCVGVEAGAQSAAMKGFENPDFGGLSIPCFRTVDDALAHIRQQLKHKK